jgi:hypothetical protein
MYVPHGYRRRSNPPVLAHAPHSPIISIPDPAGRASVAQPLSLRSPVKPSLSHSHNPPASFGILAGACRRSSGSHPHTARILCSNASISVLRTHSSRRLPRAVLSAICPHSCFQVQKAYLTKLRRRRRTIRILTPMRRVLIGILCVCVQVR